MTVDVDACVGCQACVVACQAENNVPIVGKAEAAYGRQLHWLRIERWAEGQARASDEHVPADVLPALRGRAVRAGVPGVRRVPHRGGAQRAGLQPLRRHALLRQQLPVPRAPLQLVELRVPDAARGAAQPRRHRPPARRDGEVHDVHPAHRRRQGSRAGREARGPRRRHPDGLPADVPDAGDHLRQPQGRGQHGDQADALAARLSRPGRDRHAALVTYLRKVVRGHA